MIVVCPGDIDIDIDIMLLGTIFICASTIAMGAPTMFFKTFSASTDSAQQMIDNLLSRRDMISDLAAQVSPASDLNGIVVLKD